MSFNLFPFSTAINLIAFRWNSLVFLLNFNLCESACELRKTQMQSFLNLKMPITFYCISSTLFKIYIQSSHGINGNAVSDSIAKVKFPRRKLSIDANYV